MSLFPNHIAMFFAPCNLNRNRCPYLHQVLFAMFRFNVLIKPICPYVLCRKMGFKNSGSPLESRFLEGWKSSGRPVGRISFNPGALTPPWCRVMTQKPSRLNKGKLIGHCFPNKHQIWMKELCPGTYGNYICSLILRSKLANPGQNI